VSVRAGFSGSTLAAGLLAGFVGFASSFAVVLQGLTGVGANPAQASAGLMALCLAMGLAGMALSLWFRMPISVAWSTPGAALLAASAMPSGGFPAAIGAFLVCGALIVLAGMVRPLARLVEAIPASLANAMLAGVLLPLCLAPVRAVAEMPRLAVPVVLGWAVLLRLHRLLAVPGAVVVAVVVMALTRDGMPDLSAALITPAWITPVFAPEAILGLGLPLFIVTMASQNIPGMAILGVNGYRPPAGQLFAATGLFSLLAAPFGGHAVNLAAITAALCASPDAHRDPARRWGAAAVAGAVYVAFGLATGTVIALIASTPPLLMQAVAGLALLGTLAGALNAALTNADERLPATATFLCAASGLSLFGIGGAFWGLLAGAALRAWAPK